MGITWPVRSCVVQSGYKNKPLQAHDRHICHFIWQNKLDNTHVVKGDKRGIILCVLFHSSFIMFVLCCCTCMFFHFALLFLFYCALNDYGCRCAIQCHLSKGHFVKAICSLKDLVVKTSLCCTV